MNELRHTVILSLSAGDFFLEKCVGSKKRVTSSVGRFSALF